MVKTRWITAAELQEQMDKDPEFQARKKKLDQEFEQRERMLNADEEGLIRDLANVGLEVKSVYDLVNTAESYPEAIPVLLKHLRLPHHERIREGILRALTVKEARGIATEPLLMEFKHTPSDAPGTIAGPKWLLANALAMTANDSILSEIIFLSADKNLDSDVRTTLLDAFNHMRDRWRVAEAVIKLLADKNCQVVKKSVMLLGKLKEKAAVPYLEDLLRSADQELLKEVRKALKKIQAGA